MNDTPRTDAVLLAAGYDVQNERDALYTFACQLEKELAEAKKELKEVNELLIVYRCSP